jgi:hypothetical protein
MANTIVLGLDRYPITDKQQRKLEILNLTFYAIFAFEMVVKLVGLGIKQYVRDGYNIFDFIIVFVSTIDVIISESNHIKISGSKAILSLRTFRLLRVFKLAKSWK